MPTYTLPTLSTEQRRLLDKLMAEKHGSGPDQTLDTIGAHLATVVSRFLENDIVDRSILVVAGRGPNGGGGLAAARRLLALGAWVQIVISYPPEEFQGAPAVQLALLQEEGISPAWAEEGWELPPADLILDAVIGYGLRGDPRGNARRLIALTNSSQAPIISLDVPSGLDSGKGRALSPHIGADATLALALPLIGHLIGDGPATCGRIYLADIGVPSTLYEELDLHVPPLFARDPVVSVDVVDGEAWCST